LVLSALAACGKVERNDDVADADADVDSDSDVDTETESETDALCSLPDCDDGTDCVPDGTCSEFGQLCEEGTIRPSCGDGDCGCSENDENQGLTCPDDCLPSWTACAEVGLGSTTCQQTCADAGLRCHDLCQDVAGFWGGALTYVDSACGSGETLATCVDFLPAGGGGICCCARPG
jgi:hypothetical protein